MKTIAVDFDGVIHAYSQGWQDGSIYDPPVPGALDAIRALQRDAAVFVHTTRDALTVCHWLEERGIPATTDLPPDNVYEFWNSQAIVLVTDRKLPAVAYIDDRAVRFRGNWAEALADVKEFLA